MASKDHPYFVGQRKKEQSERFMKLTKSPEFQKVENAYRQAVENYLHQLLLVDFQARELGITVEQVVNAASYYTKRLCDQLAQMEFYHTAKMLERFDLVKS